MNRFVTSVLCLMMFAGGCMAQDGLNWEWPAGRRADSVVRVRIVAIKPESRGWFGVRNSPSMAEALPDPVLVSIEAEPDGQGGNAAPLAATTLRMPKAELGAVVVGQSAELSLIGQRTVIALKPVTPR